MGCYSLELREVIEMCPDIGLYDYPVISEEYRDQLNKKIVKHYFFHEIGFDAPAKFRHYMDSTMGEIMPYYNQLIESTLIKINPLLSFERSQTTARDLDTTQNTTDSIDQTVNNTRTTANTQLNTGSDETKSNVMSSGNDTSSNTSDRTSTANNTGVTTSETSNNKDYYDTPMGSLKETPQMVTNVTVNKDNNVGTDNSQSSTTVNDTTSMENISQANTDSNTKSSTNTNSSFDETATVEDRMNNEKTGTRVGKDKESINVIENGTNIPFSDLLMRYRETFINVDRQIIAELGDLFMKIY